MQRAHFEGGVRCAHPVHVNPASLFCAPKVRMDHKRAPLFKNNTDGIAPQSSQARSCISVETALVQGVVSLQCEVAAFIYLGKEIH